MAKVKVAVEKCPLCQSDYLRFPTRNICPKCEHGEIEKVAKQYYNDKLKSVKVNI